MNTYDTQSQAAKTQPRVATILWGLSVMLVGGVALAILADSSIDASWGLIAIIGLAGLGFLALAFSGIRRERPSSDTSSDT